VIPAKDPLQAKSRLAGVISPDERHALSLRLLAHTLRVVAATPVLAKCLVVSESEEVLALAARHGARGIKEPALAETPAAPRVRASRKSANPPDERLNSAIAHATRIAAEGGATAILVLAADLPLLTPRDLRQLPKWMPPNGGVVLIPDRLLTGTNAMLVQPPTDSLFQFGPDSLARHKRRAHLNGLPAVVWSTPALRMDLDTPEDLAEIRSRAGADSPVAGIRLHQSTSPPTQRPVPSSSGVHGPGAVAPATREGRPQATVPSPIDFAAAARRLRERSAAAEQS
jgi:2-phospho-L-lactate guanylyltransferase